jgi:hypothetical protein
VPGLFSEFEGDGAAVDERDRGAAALTVAAAIAVVSGGAGQPTDEVVAIGDRHTTTPPESPDGAGAMQVVFWASTGLSECPGWANNQSLRCPDKGDVVA